MIIDYALARVDSLGAIHEPTYEVDLCIKERPTKYEVSGKVTYTGIRITYPSDYPNYALRNVRIWYSLESILQ